MQTRYMTIVAIVAAVGLAVWNAAAEPTPTTGAATQPATAASAPAPRIVYPPTMSIVKRLAQTPSTAPARTKDETELDAPVSLLELKPLPPKPVATAPASEPAVAIKPTTAPTTEPAVAVKPETPATKPVVEPVVVVKPEMPATKPATEPSVAVKPETPATKPTAEPVVVVKPEMPATKPATEPAVVVKPETPATKPAVEPVVVVKPEMPATKPATEPAVAVKPETPATKPVVEPVVVVKPEMPATRPATEPAVAVKPETPATKPVAEPVVVVKPEMPATKPATEPAVAVKPETPATAPAAETMVVVKPEIPAPVVVPFDANKVTITPSTNPNEEIMPVRRPPSTLIARPTFEPSAPANASEGGKMEDLAKPTPLTELTTTGNTKPAAEPVTPPVTKVTVPENPPPSPGDSIPTVASISGPRPPKMPPPLTPTTAPLVFGPGPGQETTPEVVAPKTGNQSKLVAASILQVNDRFITVEDVLRGLNTKLAEVPRTISEQSFREQAEKILREEIRHQVTESLVFAEATKRLSDDQKKEIDKEMVEVERDMLAQAGGSKKKLEQDLAKEDLTFETAMQNHRQQVTNSMYLRSRFMPSVVVTRRDLLSYYQKNPAEFQAEKKVQMQILAVPFKEFVAAGTGRPTATELAAAKVAAEKYIEEAAAQIKKGADFGKVVQEKSKGPAPDANGVWPLMPAGSFRETKVEDAAFAMPEGKISSIIETDSAFYIVKALKVQPGQSVSFEEAQAGIEKKIHNEQYHKIVDDYFRKLFNERAMIVESDKFMELALTRAVEKYYRR